MSENPYFFTRYRDARGRIDRAIKNGTDYFIVGRSIIASANPVKEARKFQRLAVPY